MNQRAQFIMTKPSSTIDARDIVKDIRSGMTDSGEEV
jgi:hypothetical protein